MVKAIVVLISGKGSNLKSLCVNDLAKDISCVISNNPQAEGLEIAASAGIKTIVLDHHDYFNREAYDLALSAIIAPFNPSWIILAGFMRILGANFINKFPQQIINIHPSLLPAFKGINAPQQAFNAGVKFSGATIHLVNEDLDHGHIIAQGIIAVNNFNCYNELIKATLKIEHYLYPLVIKKLLNHQYKLIGNKLKLKVVENLYHHETILIAF